jgi:hypothetical protein
MKTITVQNEKIRVTAPESVYQRFMPSVDNVERMRSGDIRVHSREVQARGAILGHAMKILGNQYEAMLLDREEFELDQIELSVVAAEAMQSVKNSYIREDLCEHSKYLEMETYNRYIGGHRLTAGMEFELDAARAYANAATGEIDFQQLFHDTSAKYSEYRTRMVFAAAREGMNTEITEIKHKTAAEHMDEILWFKKYMFELEREYRHRFDNTEFQIEVLRPDLMPIQIGTCRYGTEQSL